MDIDHRSSEVNWATQLIRGMWTVGATASIIANFKALTLWQFRIKAGCVITVEVHSPNVRTQIPPIMLPYLNMCRAGAYRSIYYNPSWDGSVVMVPQTKWLVLFMGNNKLNIISSHC